MIVVDGTLPPVRKAPDRVKTMAIASVTGSLVQTESERAREVQAWKSNLLRTKAPHAVPVLDPMIIPRQYSEDELRALQVPTQKMLTSLKQSGSAPSLQHSLDGGSGSVTASVLRGVESALELESQLHEKMKTAGAPSVLTDSVDGPVYKPLTSLTSLLEAAPVTPFTPLAATLTPPGIAPSPMPSPKNIIDPMLEAHKEHTRLLALGERPISPGEKGTVLRRYKIGLSPLQKIKNMLDDLKERLDTKGEPVGRVRREGSQRPRALDLDRRDERRAVAVAGGATHPRGDKGQPQPQQQQQRQHVIRLSNPQLVPTVQHRGPSHGINLTDGGIDDSATRADADDDDDEQGLQIISPHDDPNLYAGGVLEQPSMDQDSALSLSLTADLSEMQDTLSPSSPNHWIPHDEGGVEDPGSIFTVSGILKDSAFNDSVRLEPLSPDVTRNAFETALSRNQRRAIDEKSAEQRAQMRSGGAGSVGVGRGRGRGRGDHKAVGVKHYFSAQVSKRSPAKAHTFARADANLPLLAPPNAGEDFGIRCSGCTAGGRLWCQGCKLAFCFTCWGTVEHHSSVDSVRVMEAERQAFLTADGTGGEEVLEEETKTEAHKKEALDRTTSKNKFKIKVQDKPTAKAIPSEITFDEQNAVHFAAERKDPERFQYLHEIKVKRLTETSRRMKNHAAVVRARAGKLQNVAEKRDELVRGRLDHKQRMRIIEEQMAEEIKEASVHSHALDSVVLGLQHEKQLDNNSRSRSPNWRSQKIKSPTDRLKDEQEAILKMLDDPIDGWGWSDMPGRASRNQNYEELPFRNKREDIVWLVPEHLKDQIVETAPRPRERDLVTPKSRTGTTQDAINRVSSLW